MRAVYTNNIQILVRSKKKLGVNFTQINVEYERGEKN